jgi:GalNAc-alpha-(1->4)-GalNAc-alpha-(1->3)-diNAcBac-PP-undecaprenol alpha-1,4-N-acetyl-D-galactosaminyltransferase
MHILLTIGSLEAGGAERILCALANHWVSHGYQVSLLTLKSPDTIPFYHLDPSINLIQINQSHSRKRPWYQFIVNSIQCLLCMRKIFISIKPDIIISFMDLMNIASLLAKTGLKVPVIVCERTDPNDHRISVLYQCFRRILYPHAYRVIAQTVSAASYFLRMAPKKTIVIPNPIFVPLKYKIEYALNSKNIITIGRLDAIKDQGTLIQAFANLLNHNPNLTLTIYGEGVERKSLEALIQSLNLSGKVKLPGTIKHVQEALLQADLFIFPSRYEGFPNALCEAMAVGLPVIASNVTGNVDLVQDKKNGRLFPVGDVQALTNLALELLNDSSQCQVLGTQARRVSEEFNPEAIFTRWDALITPLG